MKRLFFQTKTYDYTTIAEAEKDMEKMREKGWIAKDNLVYKNGQDEFPYSVEYFKER